MIKLPKILEDILEELQTIGAKPIVVGGCIRDSFLGLKSKDYDIEIFSVDSLEFIEKILNKFGKVKQVGKSFGVLILNIDDYSFDFALARTEKKIGTSHRDFKVYSQGNLSYKQASLRRDFTINSIGYDFFKDEILDPHAGLDDLKKRKIKHINDETFIEDPLRIYRAIQFSSRFNFSLDEKTFLLCKEMVFKNELDYLAKERVFEEFKKLFLKSIKPSKGFTLLKDLGIMKKYFYELDTLDKRLYTETLNALNELERVLSIKNIKDEYRKLYLFFAVLCHKIPNKFLNEKDFFLLKLSNEKRFIEKVLSLSLNTFDLDDCSLANIKKLSLKVCIEDLYLVYYSFESYDKNTLEKILNIAKNEDIHKKALKPFIQGKDLLSLGFKPSVKFKGILEYCFNLQIEKDLKKEEIIKKLINL